SVYLRVCFFQAEDGIRDFHVTGVQTCALPILFKLIQEESKTDWKEMYQVFNMGHRMELYLDESIADEIIQISRSFDIEAKIVGRDRKSTRLNSSHVKISYAVFCLKKKKK